MKRNCWGCGLCCFSLIAPLDHTMFLCPALGMFLCPYFVVLLCFCALPWICFCALTLDMFLCPGCVVLAWLLSWITLCFCTQHILCPALDLLQIQSCRKHCNWKIDAMFCTIIFLRGTRWTVFLVPYYYKPLKYVPTSQTAKNQTPFYNSILYFCDLQLLLIVCLSPRWCVTIKLHASPPLPSFNALNTSLCGSM